MTIILHCFIYFCQGYVSSFTWNTTSYSTKI